MASRRSTTSSRPARCTRDGYCIGGTLLAITAATMARDGDDRLADVTLLAAQTDFSEAGELMLFVDEQPDYVLNVMWDQGRARYAADGRRPRALRSNDLIWSKMMREYLIGERGAATEPSPPGMPGPNPPMPYRMHSQCLRALFLEIDLTTGRYAVDRHFMR